MSKNEFEEGTPEYAAFEAGVASEQARLLKVLNTYHKRFCNGLIEDHAGCSKTMEIRYLYEFIAAVKTLK